MKIVRDLFHTLDMHAVLGTLMENADFNETEKGEKEFYEYYANHRMAYEEILTLEPAFPPPEVTELVCFLTTCNHGHIHICGLDPLGERYDLDLLEWEKWLALPVKIDERLKNLTPEKVLANILYEMTYVAYSNAAITELREDMLGTVEAIKKQFGIEEAKPTLH